MLLTNFILPVIGLFVFFSAILAKGSVPPPKIDYETLAKNDFEFLKQNELVVIAVGNLAISKIVAPHIQSIEVFLNFEVSDIMKLDVSNTLNQFKSSIDTTNANENQAVSFFTTSDSMFIKVYAVLKFPQIIFFRNGRYLLFKGDLTLKNLNEWLESNRDRLTHDLTDATFEHDTQAASGATTGDWFVLL
jgi:hypothetical protein